MVWRHVKYTRRDRRRVLFSIRLVERRSSDGRTSNGLSRGPRGSSKTFQRLPRSPSVPMSLRRELPLTVRNTDVHWSTRALSPNDFYQNRCLAHSAVLSVVRSTTVPTDPDEHFTDVGRIVYPWCGESSDGGAPRSRTRERVYCRTARKNYGIYRLPVMKTIRSNRLVFVWWDRIRRRFYSCA